jgi:uncharacterized small protein (DUF1192 family)
VTSDQIADDQTTVRDFFALTTLRDDPACQAALRLADEVDRLRADLTSLSGKHEWTCDEVDRLRADLAAQAPVIDAARAWLRQHTPNPGLDPRAMQASVDLLGAAVDALNKTETDR